VATKIKQVDGELAMSNSNHARLGFNNTKNQGKLQQKHVET
jgi:hypothetical protein